jgi:hypothetical protein
VRELLFAGDTHAARHYLKRIHTIERVMIEHISVIETMSPGAVSSDVSPSRHSGTPSAPSWNRTDSRCHATTRPGAGRACWR